MTSGPLPRVILDFDAVPWESPGPGVRYKSIVQERQRLRLLEFSAGFEEESWCTGGHAFHVLDGSFSLLFAPHYAQSARRPDPEATARLREAYGGAVADEILLILRIISLGNLAGNTFKSFVERVRGRGSGGPGFLDDLLVFLVTAPLFGPIGWMMRREGR